MAINLKTRLIQLNLNFFWESENININPSGWVLLSSELNNVNCLDNNYVDILFHSKDSLETYSWLIPSFFKNIFKKLEYPTNSINLFSLKYNPEQFNGVYSQYIDKYSESSYRKLPISNITDLSGNPIDLNLKTVGDLLDKQFTYSLSYNKDKGIYEERIYTFKYSDYKFNLIDLKLNLTSISDQLIVQLFNTSILKNSEPITVPLKELEDFICKLGLIWKYKIAPIMPYGVLDSLAVEGEINLMNIGIFEQKINKFKYYNTEFQSLLLLDMTSYNSVGHTVDRIKLTFSDVYGEVCDLFLPKMLSYNGQMLVSIPLDGTLHEGMYAYDGIYNNDINIHPNIFNTDDSLVKENKVFRSPKYDFVLNKEGYVDSFKKEITSGNEQYEYAYHDKSEPEGLQPNYLYWVTVSYTIEETGEVIALEDGFWYWTNTKYNEYYYNNDYNNYNDIPFDLDLTVSASISGNAVISSYEDSIDQATQDSLRIYTEKNLENLPFIVQIYPDFENYYGTLRVNTLDTSSYLSSIKFGIDSNNQIWDRSSAIINIDDSKYDSEPYSYVHWNVYNKDKGASCTLQYYPSFGNTSEIKTTDAESITNLKNVNYSDLSLYLTEDIKRTFAFRNVYSKLKVNYFKATGYLWKDKYIKAGMHGIDRSKEPRTIIWSRDSKEEIESLLNNTLEGEDWCLDMTNFSYGTEGERKSAAYLSPTGSASESMYANAWFSAGGTAVPINKIIEDTLFLGKLHFYGMVGSLLYTHFTDDWKCDYGIINKSWEDWKPYLVREDWHAGSTHASLNLNYIFYRYGKDYYIFDIPDTSKAPDYIKYSFKLYGIDKSTSYSGTVDKVLSEILQNERDILNKQDLIILIEGVENPTIYLLRLNVNLWKTIKGCNSEAKCLQFKFNGPALTVLNLSIKLKYPQKQLDTLEYFLDPDSGDILTFDTSNVYYVKNGKPVFIEDCEFTKDKGFRIDYLLNLSNSKWDGAFVFCSYFRQGNAKLKVYDGKVIHLTDRGGNRMSGTLSVPYKTLK